MRTGVVVNILCLFGFWLRRHKQVIIYISVDKSFLKLKLFKFFLQDRVEMTQEFRMRWLNPSEPLFIMSMTIRLCISCISAIVDFFANFIEPIELFCGFHELRSFFDSFHESSNILINKFIHISFACIGSRKTFPSRTELSIYFQK